MTPEEIDSRLAQTLDDRRLSRSERQALCEFAASVKSDADRRLILNRAFEIARESLANPDDRPFVEWLEDVVKTLREGESTTRQTLAEAYFSPGDECSRAITRLMDQTRRTIDVCVFTITDDRLADALIAAHRRGVAIRVVTDDAKAEDLGSDVAKFEQAGIPLRVDRSPFHMHHKFAIFDGSRLLTGSYNLDPRGVERQRGEPDRHRRPSPGRPLRRDVRPPLAEAGLTTRAVDRSSYPSEIRTWGTATPIRFPARL